MKQNSTLKHYLIIGLIINFCFLSNSCDKFKIYAIAGEFRFVNTTSYNITFDQANFQEFNVPANSTTVIYKSQKSSFKVKEAVPSNYRSPFVIPSIDNVIVKFGNNKCLIMQANDGINNIRNINNFVAEKISNNNFRFTFTFTEADYNRAVACP